jgi:hypothetical protein
MGLFGTLMQKIFHAGANAEAPPDAIKRGQINESRVTAAERAGVPVGAQIAPGMQAPTGAAPVPQGPVDIAAILDGMAASHHEKLDWKHSIVDLMKLVGMESSLSERKELAADLHYTGDTGDSAKMNMWLHKEVMRKLAENGGKVPADLLAH